MGIRAVPAMRRIGRTSSALLALASLWCGCFYSVAELAPTTVASRGGSEAGGASGGTASGGAGTGGSAEHEGGDTPEAGADSLGAAGANDCSASDVDCPYRTRCSSSSLIPHLLVGGQSGPFAVAADETAVVWSDRDARTPKAGRVRRRAVTFSTAPTPVIDLATNQPDPGEIALDANFAYWVSTNGNVSRVSRASAGAAIDVIASGQGSPSGVVLDDTFVYWLGGAMPSVLRREKEPPRGAVQVLAASEAEPSLLAQDASTVYWTTSSGFVESVPKIGGTARELVTPQTLGKVLGAEALDHFEAAGIAVDDTWVYFRARGLRAAPAKDDTGKLLRVGKDGKNLTLLLDNHVGGISELCLDSGQLYFTTGSTGNEVWRVASDGSSPVLLNCESAPYPNGITTSATRVYWTNLNGAALFWASK